MSESTVTQNGRSDFRWQLLTTVSAVALLASVYAGLPAKAADGEPPLWIELGGQFAQQETDQDAFLPPFSVATPRPPFAVIPAAQIEKASPWTGNGTAKITFESEGSGWIFSAAILYGRSSRNQSTNQVTMPGGAGNLYMAYQRIAAENGESHAVADFQAGKDIGLGMFGHSGSSIVSLGVRYAQFSSRSNSIITSHPTNVGSYSPAHHFNASFDMKRKFTGVGPSLSWDASAGLIGNPSEGSIAFDWSLNGALLFGRQRVQGHHETTNLIFERFNSPFVTVQTPVYHHSGSPDRSKQVIVPNLGGFAGVSWRYPSAKVTLGYRADFFFGGMDGGIDVTHRENVGFYGPFASVSVGIGG